jgi:hypothetical protein
MNTEPKRRFPPPWTAKQLEGCYVVEDSNGIRIAYIYADTNVMHSASSYHHLSWDEARRFARAIAQLPEFLSGANAAVDQSRKSSTVRPNEEETD